MTPIIGPGGKVRAYVRHVGNRKELLAPGGRVLEYYDEEKDQTILPGSGGLLCSHRFTLNWLFFHTLSLNVQCEWATDRVRRGPWPGRWRTRSFPASTASRPRCTSLGRRLLSSPASEGRLPPGFRM